MSLKYQIFENVMESCITMTTTNDDATFIKVSAVCRSYPSFFLFLPTEYVYLAN